MARLQVFLIWLLVFLLGPVLALAQNKTPPQVLYNQPGVWQVPQGFKKGIVKSGAVYDAMAFGGCIWDGAHDVYPCISAALAAAGAAEVALPAGVLPLSQPLTPANGATLRGVGKATILQPTTGNISTPYVLSLASTTNVTIRDLTFDGGGE